MKDKLIKEDIIFAVCRETHKPRYMVEEIVDSTLRNITLALSQSKSVQFAGFGTFEPKERAARTGRNPHKNTPVPIPARIVPSFKPGKNLKDAVTKQI